MIQRFRNISSILMTGALVVAMAAAAGGPGAGCSRRAGTGPAAPTPPCGPGVTGKNIASDSRCFELRTYTVKGEGPGSIDLLHSRFREHTNRLFRKHGMTIVGFWQPLNAGMESTLIYLLAYKDARGARRGVERIPNGSGMDGGRQGDAGGHRGPVGLHELDRLRADEIDLREVIRDQGFGIMDTTAFALLSAILVQATAFSRRAWRSAASTARAPQLPRQQVPSADPLARAIVTSAAIPLEHPRMDVAAPGRPRACCPASPPPNRPPARRCRLNAVVRRALGQIADGAWRRALCRPTS